MSISPLFVFQFLEDKKCEICKDEGKSISALKAHPLTNDPLCDTHYEVNYVQ
jgi:hypothetical protein